MFCCYSLWFYILKNCKFAVEGPNFAIFQIMPSLCFKEISNKIWSSTTDIAVMGIVAVSYEREIQWVAVSNESNPFWTWTGQKNLELWIYFSLSLWKTLKVNKFQNKSMKSSLLPKYEPNIVRISALYCATL